MKPLKPSLTPSKPDCANCPWSDPETKQPRHQPVLGTFPTTKDGKLVCLGVLVGEGPGSEEVEKGKPFVGRTGVWLDDRLSENQLDRNQLVVLNAQGCQPPKGLKTDDTMRAATKACRPLFLSQFELVSKLPTLAMGKWASAASNNGAPISTLTGRGFIRDNLLVTYHPTYAAFYNPWVAGEFINDMQRFKRMLSGTLEPLPKVITKPKVSDLRKLVKTGLALACDIETRAKHGRPDYEGKDPFRADLRTIALGIANLGIAYWWGSDTKVQQEYINILEDERITKIFHNGHMFDVPILRRFGINVVNYRDTRDERRAISATSRLSLRQLTSIYTDFPPWKETSDEK